MRNISPSLMHRSDRSCGFNAGPNFSSTTRVPASPAGPKIFGMHETIAGWRRCEMMASTNHTAVFADRQAGLIRSGTAKAGDVFKRDDVNGDEERSRVARQKLILWPWICGRPIPAYALVQRQNRLEGVGQPPFPASR